MVKSAICELLGIRYPVFQGGMAWIADGALAAAVSNGGGLGIIAAGNAPGAYVREQIRIARVNTACPIGVNIMLMSSFADEVTQVVVEEKVEVVTTGAGNPSKYMKAWKEAGIKVIPVVASVAMAKLMIRLGASALIAEGGESGGHVGELTTMVLVPQVCDATTLPVLAAGGIADGRGAFMLGACGVQMGTRFLSAYECTIHPAYKERILKATDLCTMVTGKRLGHPVRSLRTPFARNYANFDPKQLCTVINRYGVTSFCAPPTVYRYLVRKGIPDMPTLKHASTAGEILAPEVFRKFAQRTGLELREGYGQTETTLLMANFRGMQPVEGSMGTISPLYRIELMDKEGNPVPDGEIGEVVILPPENGKPIGVFSGYLDHDEQYRHVWRGGVYHTGDAAYRDSQGRYWFHGRFDDIIKTGGYRVGPYEVENVLMEHPAVVECSVVGVPDALRGQAIKAFIVPGNREPSAELEKEIKDFCNARLAEYKWVRLIEFVTEMPKTISGKIRKTELRAAN